MERYALIDCIFLVVAVAITLRVKPPRLTRAKYSALGILVVLTAIFDNTMIAYGVMAYNSHYILGIHIVHMPIEDVAYTIAAVLFVPAIYELISNRNRHD